VFAWFNNRHLLSSRVLTSALGGHVGFLDNATNLELRILPFKARAACRTLVYSSIAGITYSHPELQT
jgi:hypothetical protein